MDQLMQMFAAGVAVGTLVACPFGGLFTIAILVVITHSVSSPGGRRWKISAREIKKRQEDE